jgi:sec-independent protein translocase protein TatA
MGLGPWHLLILLAVVLIFFGPSRLPGLGKSIGEAIRGFKKGLDNDEIDVTDSAKREQIKPTAETASQTQKEKSKNSTES